MAGQRRRERGSERGGAGGGPAGRGAARRRGPAADLPDEARGEQRSLEALRAHQAREDSGRETPGQVGRPASGVLVQVCMRCGKEYTFDEQPPPLDLCCEKCGNRVFRSFFDMIVPDDVESDYRESTERDLSTDDDGEDVTRGDVLDLNNP